MNIREVVLSVIQEVCGNNNITEHYPLTSDVMDSVNFIESVVEIEEKLEIEFGDDMLMYTAYDKISDILDYCEILCAEQRD